MRKKRIVLTALVFALMVGCAGCGRFSGKTDGKSLTIWAEPSTVKILQDDDGKAVKEAKEKNVLKIQMAKNESEGVQLMMYAKKKINEYQVSVSDLESKEDKNQKITADQIDIYMLKYQTVEILQSTPNDAFPVGSRVPDPMLPMKTAVEYEENKVSKGENQSIYFDVTTTKETPAGVYEGAVTLTAGKETYRIAMEVTVEDVELPDTPGLKTAFALLDRDLFATAEMDASDEMTATYVKTLMKFNMGSSLPFEGEGGLTHYLELLREYYNEPGFTAYRVYYDPSGAAYNGVACTYNAPLLKEYLLGIAQISVEDKIDYLEKAYCYFYTVADEPSSEEQFKIAKNALDVYKQILTDADAELRLQYAGTENYEYYSEVISNSLLTLPDLLPGSFLNGQLQQWDIEDYTIVPLIQNFQNKANRKQMVQGREDMELWTYTCNFPTYPYPTSHIDDYNLGFRLTSWMCKDYDWDGFLQWRSVGFVYGTIGGSAVSDPWEVVNTASGRPGEGIFLYPGKKYGLDEPCPSIRAFIYRDGTEDYEVLRTVEKIYEENGIESTYALSDIYQKVFTGVIPITDSYVFENVRAELFELITALRSDVGILYQDVEIGFDSAEIIFKCVNEQADVTIDGESVKADKDGLYHITIDLTKQSSCKIKVTCDKEEKEYIKILLDGVLGTVCDFEKAGEAKDYVLVSKKDAKTEISNQQEKALSGKGAVHMTLNPEKNDVIPYFVIDKSSKLVESDWKDISGMQFYLYNASSEDINMEITYFTSSETALDTYRLTAGEWTLIEVTMPEGIKDADKIQEFDFNFKQGSSAELYLDNFVTITKGEK